MYRRILVAVDGSRTASQGLREAIKLAHDQRARLLLVHVVDEYLPVMGFEPVAYPADFIEATKQSGRAILKKAESAVRKRGVAVQSVMLETVAGPAADLIVRQARKWRADLIVLGTHGRRGLRRLVLGSDAEQVLRTAPVPVLLIRSKPAAPRSRSRARRTR